MSKGFTVEDLEEFLQDPDKFMIESGGKKIAPEKAKVILGRMEKPCCGEGKIDSQVRIFKMKQREKRGEV